MRSKTKTIIESYLLDMYVTGYEITDCGGLYDGPKMGYTVRFASKDGITGKEYAIPVNQDFLREIQDNLNKPIQLEIKILDSN